MNRRENGHTAARLAPEQLGNLKSRERVKARGWLVEQEEAGLCDHFVTDGDALSLTAPEAAAELHISAVSEPERAKQLLGESLNQARMFVCSYLLCEVESLSRRHC